MCFSATTSFISSAVLSVTGIACMKKQHDWTQLMFAGIPFLFAVQQLSEGLLWLSITTSSLNWFQLTLINFFLVFALVIWPLWVPLSIFFLEKEKRRKIILGMIAGVGLLFSLGSVYCLLVYNTSAIVSNYHIYYILNIPYRNGLIFSILYVMPTVFSHFVSSIKHVQIIGGVILFSYLITKFFFNDYLISVWCFFAATTSVLIYFFMRNELSNSEIKSMKYYTNTIK